MRPPRRLLAGAAAAVALCLAATGCDSSPFAASVDGHLIKEAALNKQLSLLDANQTFITTSIEAPASEDGGGEGMQVKGEGSSTYTTAWTASVLTAMVTASVVRQHLAAVGDLPTAFQTQVARAVDSAAYENDLAWYHFSAQAQATISQNDADLAQVVPRYKSYTQAEFHQIYDAFEGSLFTNVCIRNVGVDVTGPSGVDYPASLAKAKSLVSQINAAGVSGANNASFGGSVSCYDHAAFDALPLSLIKAALGLKAGHAGTPTKTADGYEVVAVMSRTLVPFAAFTKAVSVPLQVNSINSTGSTVPAVEALVAKAHIKIDPVYGTWEKTKQGYAVVTPSGPSDKAAKAAGAV